jgi:hypothetical protein
MANCDASLWPEKREKAMIMTQEEQVLRMWRALRMNTADIAREIRPGMSEPEVEHIINAMLDAEYRRLLEERRRSPSAAVQPAPVL